MSTVVDDETPRPIASHVLLHGGLAAALVASADFLFYDHPLGISVAIFAGLVAVGSLVASASCLTVTRLGLGLIFATLGTLPVVEDVNTLSIGACIAGLVAAAVAFIGDFAGAWPRPVGAMAGFLLTGPIALPRDVARAASSADVTHGARQVRSQAILWAVPLVLGGVFLLLFGSANPVIEEQLRKIISIPEGPSIDGVRLLFWAASAMAVWAFVVPRAIPVLALPERSGARTADHGALAGLASLLTSASVLRSLLVFNALFAVETALDIAYLWKGVALPAGMSHASYAHRGAYPLVAAAILAGVFTLAAFRSGRDADQTAGLRVLLTLWIGQTIFLVVSSALRLKLYVDHYSLTYWRFAAFVWFALVAVGLGLLLMRVRFRRPTAWLLGINALTLALTLYACSFVDLPRLIADYNVDHSVELTGRGQIADTAYLRALGPGAYPALLRLARARDNRYGDAGGSRMSAEGTIADIKLYVATHGIVVPGWDPAERADWRGWTYRQWRLVRTFQRLLNGLPAQ